MRKIFITLCILSINACLFAQDPSVNVTTAKISKKEDNLTALQKESRAYRSQGMELQKTGDIDQAMHFYEKAIQIDSAHAVAYNDLGTVYETKGLADQAEACYLKAITLDPHYLSPYSNLALLYEDKRDLEKAYTYWKKRADLGITSDPWTQRSRKRLEDLIQIVPSLREKFVEEESMKLMKDIEEKKRVRRLKDIEEAKAHAEKADKLSARRQYKEAAEELKAAISLSPNDQALSAKAGKVKERIKEQRKEEVVNNLQGYFQSGIRLYRQDNPQAARQEFERMLELTASPQEE